MIKAKAEAIVGLKHKKTEEKSEKPEGAEEAPKNATDGEAPKNATEGAEDAPKDGAKKS